MKIRMTTSLAGVDFALAPGEETDRFGKAEAIRLIEAGYAVPVNDKPAVEKAVKRRVSEERSEK